MDMLFSSMDTGAPTQNVTPHTTFFCELPPIHALPQQVGQALSSMSEPDDGIAYNQTSGGLPSLEKASVHIAADVCFLRDNARANAL
jgi:hypothetical protein